MSNIEKILEEQGVCVTYTKGDSMLPMLKEGRDRVIIEKPVFPLKKYDVPVYRRGDHYTMHRIIRVTKNGYIICGDNRANLEKDITKKDIIGVLAGFYQGSEYISRDDEKFIYYAKKAVKELPKRRLKDIQRRLLRKIRKIFKGDGK